MKMPVVSLNQMAMNESVAATCCFKVDTINGGVYEKVLSGGAITLTTVNKPQYIENVKKFPGWTKLEGDYDEAFTDGNYPSLQKDIFGNPVWCVMNAGAIIGIIGTEITTTYAKADQVLISWDHNTQTAYPLVVNRSHRYCDHQGSYCDYVESISSELVRQHVGATVEHAAGGKTWANAHTAMRFNS